MARLIEATAPAEVAAVRELFAEYVRTVDEPCCFMGFDRELAALPYLAEPTPGALCFELRL